MGKPRHLTLKQDVFVKEAARTLNATEAASIAYKIPKSRRYLARAVASENLAKPYIAQAIEKELEKAGVGNGLISQQFHAVLTSPAKDMPTWSEKHSFVKTFLQVTGQLKDSGPNVNVGLIIES